MRRVAAVAVLLLSLTTFASFASSVSAQNAARERQAAADAYDRGTTAYVDQAFEEAATWFETANRKAPAAPALMQAIRAHEKSDNYTRAATLAIELQRSYRDDPSAAEFADEVLQKHAGTLLKVEVSCDEDCDLNVDGKIEDYLTFFSQPGIEHTVTAMFATGSKTLSVQGAAGETRELTFEAPAPPPVAPVITMEPMTGTKDTGSEERPPLPPLATWIGLGITVALGGATVGAGVYALNGVPAYEKAAEAAAADGCRSMDNPTEDCLNKIARAEDLLNDGRSRQLLTNILIGATAVAAVGTGVIAFLLTDWSGGDQEAQNARKARGITRVELQPQPGGAVGVLKGQF